MENMLFFHASVNYRTRTAKSEELTQLGTPITTIETCVCTDSAKGDHCEVYKLSNLPLYD